MGLFEQESGTNQRKSTKVEILWVYLRSPDENKELIYKSRNFMGLFELCLLAIELISTKVEILWVYLSLVLTQTLSIIYKSRNFMGLFEKL